MKLVNLYSRKKNFILKEFQAFKNLQLQDHKKNYNFFIFWDDSILNKIKNLCVE